MGATSEARRELAALAIASGRTYEQAVTESGASLRTVKRWYLDDPSFRQRVSQIRSEIISRAVGKLVDNMGDAAETLKELLSDTKGSVRLGAARATLELATKLKESTEMEERLAALEQQQRELRGEVEQPEQQQESDDGNEYQEPLGQAGEATE